MRMTARSAVDAPSHDLDVAEEWWAVERFDDGIVLLSERHVHPLLRCNV